MSATYWDAGAIVLALGDAKLRARMNRPEQFTRPHSLAEVFSTLTSGKLGRRYSADAVARILAEVQTEISFVDLTPAEIVAGMERAKGLAVMGGRIHDLLHALAADKAGAERVLTTDRNDLAGLTAAQIEVLV